MKRIKWTRFKDGRGWYATIGAYYVCVHPPIVHREGWDVVVSNYTADGYVEGWYVAHYTRARSCAHAKRIAVELVRGVKAWSK